MISIEYINKKIKDYNELKKGKIETKLFKTYILEYLKLEKENNIHCDILSSFPKNELGLVPDSIRQTEKFKIADDNFKKSFKNLQNFNLKNKQLNNYYSKHFRYILRNDLALNLENIK